MVTIYGKDSCPYTQAARDDYEKRKVPFTYVNVEDSAAVRGMLDAGMPQPMAEAMIHLVQALRGIGRIPPGEVVPQLLGRPARSFQQWASENATTFQ